MYKQNINLSITKGSLLVIFQFSIHLMNLYIFLPPGSGSASVHMDPDPGDLF